MSEELVEKIYKVTDGAIHGFFREHRYLSNYHVCEVPWLGQTFTSTEAAFQATKSMDPEEWARFALYDPSTSKVEGRKVKIREDWEEVKEDVMFVVNYIKFCSHPELAEKLLATGDKELVEDNWWQDRYWGRHFGDGKNMLGITLMQVRDRIKKLKGEGVTLSMEILAKANYANFLNYKHEPKSKD